MEMCGSWRAKGACSKVTSGCYDGLNRRNLSAFRNNLTRIWRGHSKRHQRKAEYSKIWGFKSCDKKPINVETKPHLSFWQWQRKLSHQRRLRRKPSFSSKRFIYYLSISISSYSYRFHELYSLIYFSKISRLSPSGLKSRFQEFIIN